MKSLKLKSKLLLGVWLGFNGISMGIAGQNTDYKKEIESWRNAREMRLKAEDGWLSLAGLYWLKEGSNSAGTALTNTVRLPEGTALAHAGRFELRGKAVQFFPENSQAALADGRPISGSADLKSDENGTTPTALTIGRLKLIVISRSSGLGVRIKDPEAPSRKNFKGLSWYPIQENYKVMADFISFDPPKNIPVPNILGGTDASKNPGKARFKMAGKEVELLAIEEGTELFFIFKDGTNQKGTYPAGRFLYTSLPKEGKVILDFNKAFTPPCAFTRYATCPLPPRDNFLEIAIPAGEKYSGKH